jgi:hypothetical protein
MKTETTTAAKATKISQNDQTVNQQSRVAARSTISQTRGSDLPPEQRDDSGIQEGHAKEEAAKAKRTQYLLIGGGIVLVALLVGIIVLLASFPQATRVIRDIAIVFVAVETFLIGMALLVLVVQIEELIRVLRDEIQPLLRSVNDTAATVKGTTKFVSHNMVSPIIRVASFTAGLTTSLRRVADDLRVVVGAAQARQDGVRQSTNTYTGGMEDE